MITRKREPHAKDFPTHSFIHHYMKHMEGLETSYIYDFWCACWLISIACGRAVIVDRPRIPVHMNMYLCLCAESGVTRKSTAVEHATKIARLFDAPERNYEIIQSRMTATQLEKKLSERTEKSGAAWGMISISEMVNFFGKARSNGIVGLLTDLYDCPQSREGGGSAGQVGETNIREVCINLITASTPSWLIEEITPSVIEGGFTSRTLFVWSEEPKKAISWPEEKEDRSAVQHTFASDLCKIRDDLHEIKNKVSINEKALAYFDRWYRTRHHYRDSFRASFGSREDSHILRLAAILCIADGTKQIQLQHIKAAVTNVIRVRDEATKLFEGLGSKTGIVIAIDRIRDTLVGAGREVVTRTDINRKVQTFIRKDQLDAIMDIMKELSMVQQFEIPSRKGGGRPVTVYRGTNAIIRKGAIDEVLLQLQ
jgi:predicted transcriptional regulator